MRPRLFFACLIAACFAFSVGPASAAERFAFEMFLGPESEVEETGNLYSVEEGGEIVPLEIWGQNPSLDTRGRLIAFYQDDAVYVTDYKGLHTRKALTLPENSDAASPQWIPGGGFLSDGTGNIQRVQLASVVWTVYTPISWAGKQWGPAVSPDGNRIAFLSETNPAGEDLPGKDPAIYVANLDGSEPELVASPEWIAPVSAPSFSPDGSSVVVSAYGEFNEWESEDLASIDIESKAVTQVTFDEEDYEREPDWLADGRIVFVEEDDSTGDLRLMSIDEESGQETLLPAFTEGEWLARPSGRQPVNWPALTEEATSLVEQLLLQYAPTLKYDSGETYRALGVNSIIKLYSGSEPSESNRLVNGEGETLFYASPSLSEPSLQDNILAPADGDYWGTETPVSSSHRLVERSTYEEDASAMQEEPALADRIYGRAVYTEGHWWLQYWLWYYYNDFNLSGFGDHEGDWEYVQIRLGEHGNPQQATYSQHGDSSADSCEFETLNWTVGRYANVSPVIYPAQGRHASYVRPGLALGSIPYDTTDGDGYAARPIVESMPVENWAGWPGRWGDSLGDGKSPIAPISQESKWATPGEFDAQAEACPYEGTGSVTARRNPGWRVSVNKPKRPLVDATSKGKAIVVTLRQRPKTTKRRLGFDVSLLSREAVVTPVHRLAWGQSARIHMTKPDGPGPYTLVVRSRARSGVASRSVRVEIGSRRHGEASRPFERARNAMPTRLPRRLGRQAVASISQQARLAHGPNEARLIERRKHRALEAARLLWRAPRPNVARDLVKSLIVWNSRD